MLLMIAYTKVDQLRNKKMDVAETVTEKAESGSPQSLLLSDRLSGFSDVSAAEEGADTAGKSAAGAGEDGAASEEELLGPAEKMDVKAARKEPYGLVIELDHVSANKISLHGTFGYMVFELESLSDGTLSAKNTSAVTLEELGGLTMGGAAYTDVLAGDGSALIVPGIHNEEIARRRKFLYIEETSEITGGIVAPDWMMKKMADNDYTDAVVDGAYTEELTALLREDASKLLYGPAVIPEYDSNTYGFLAADGENLETVWYGIWNRDIGTITRISLFQ